MEFFAVEVIPQITQIKHKLTNAAKEHKIDELRFTYGKGRSQATGALQSQSSTLRPVTPRTLAAAASGSSPVVGDSQPQPGTPHGEPAGTIHPETITAPGQPGEI